MSKDTQDRPLVKYPLPIGSKDDLLLYIRAINAGADCLRTRAQLEQDPELIEKLDDDLEALRTLKFTLETIYHIGRPI